MLQLRSVPSISSCATHGVEAANASFDDSHYPIRIINGSRHFDIDVDGAVRKLQGLTDENDCAFELRREAMLKVLPLLSWNLDPHTTSMHVLAQAAQRIEEQGWG